MSINIHQKKSSPTILTSYSFNNNNPQILSSYQSNTLYNANSFMGTPQFQPPSSFYQNPGSHQVTIDNVTSSFGLNNHIESIPMANSIYRNDLAEEQLQQVEHLLLNQPITPITNINSNGNNNNINKNSIINSKLSSIQSSLQNTKNRQQISHANYNTDNYIPIQGNYNINRINYNNINKSPNRYWNQPIPYIQEQHPQKNIQQQQQKIQYININQTIQYQNPTSNSNSNRKVETPLLQKMKERQEQQKCQKQYKQIQQRLSNNIRILSHRSRSKNKSQRSQISRESRRQSSNSNITYNYQYRTRSQNKNPHQENSQKVKVLSKIVQKLKNQQKDHHTTHIQSHDRNRKKSPNTNPNSNTNVIIRKQQTEHRNKTNPTLHSNNLQSKKIQELLKDIKQLNKQNSKAIYTIKRTTAKDNTPKQHKTQQQEQGSFSGTPPQIPSSDFIQQNVYNQNGACPTCGCGCRMKKKAKGEVQQVNNMINNEQTVNGNKIRYL